MGTSLLPYCKDYKDNTDKCFARTNDGKCQLLLATCIECKFKKPNREITNGIKYPYNPPPPIEQPSKFKSNTESVRKKISYEQYVALMKA